jgi:RNA polymerase sigma-70 factor (ECF subfamily)
VFLLLEMSEARKLRLAPPGSPALDERTDEELMVLAAAQHREAFAVLVKRHVDKVVSYCTKVTSDRQAGRELAQETFLQVWAHRADYTPRRPFSAFLFTVARNRCRNHGRWWRRWLRREAFSAQAAQVAPVLASSSLDELLARERQDRVNAAISRLPFKQREAILLRFDQGLDYPELARVLRSSETAIRSRVFQGLKKLRALLQEEPA